MNSVLDKLCSDHANFGKLLNVIEQQSQLVADAGTPDFDILTKAVEYLEGYPTIFHHTIENVLCLRLKDVAPASTKIVDEIMLEHSVIRSRLARFTEIVANARNGSSVARSAIVDAANEFVESEWAHMERERTELFPIALATFGEGDWSFVERRAPVVKDILFGPAPAVSLKHLHLLLLDCSTREETTTLLNSAVS